MLAPERVHDVEQLIASGEHSFREIARRTGVSRASISAIAHGTRQVHHRLETVRESSVPQRCRDCGAMAVMPCRTCLARRYRQQAQVQLRQQQSRRCA